MKIVLLLIALSMAISGLQMAFAPAAAEAATIDRIVARINDEIVTLHDLRQSLTPFVLQRGTNPAVLEDRVQRERIMREALDDLVERKLLLEEAKKLDLRISDEEVDQWLAYTRQQQGMTEADFNATLAQYGLNPKDYREVVRENLLKIRLINVRVGSQINIADAEVDAAYRQRFGAAGAGETFLTVSHILIKPASAERADAREAFARAEHLLGRLRAGEDFATLAREHSEGPGAASGGDLGTFRRGELDPTFEKAAFAVAPGELSAVVETQFGFHIIKVTAREERASADADEKKAQIRGELQQRAMERQLEIYLQNLKNRSFVEVKY